MPKQATGQKTPSGKSLLSQLKSLKLEELQELENKWSSELLTHGGVHTGMTKIESDIKSKRNEIKYQDVQENLAIAG